MIEQAPERGTGRFGRGKRGAAPAKNAAATSAATSTGNGTEKPASEGCEEGTSAAAPAKAKKRRGSHGNRRNGHHNLGPSRQACARLRAPKGVTNVVRKGQSAAAKAHRSQNRSAPGRSGHGGQDREARRQTSAQRLARRELLVGQVRASHRADQPANCSQSVTTMPLTAARSQAVGFSPFGGEAG